MSSQKLGLLAAVLVSVITTNKTLFGESTATSAGQASFDKEGRATVGCDVAAVLLAAPSFRAASEDDERAVREYLEGSIPTEEGPYDAGPPVRLRIEKLKGIQTQAPDGVNVNFDPLGWALCGANTAESFRPAYKDVMLVESLAVAAEVAAESAGTEDSPAAGEAAAVTPEAPADGATVPPAAPPETPGESTGATVPPEAPADGATVPPATPPEAPAEPAKKPGRRAS